MNWLRRLLCIHTWRHERNGDVRTWTCKKCLTVQTMTDIPVPRGQVPPRRNPGQPPIAFGIINDQGYWVGIWNDRYAAELVLARGQPTHGERIVPLYGSLA
jgi:hypothetical protein